MSKMTRTALVSSFKPGDIVRYNHGCTALARLVQPHAGGWSADQCMGGSTYISESFDMRLADEEDMRRWNKCAWHRGDGIPPIWRPLIKKEDGRWVVRLHHGVPNRWRAAYDVMVSAAQNFTWKLNSEGA